MICDALVVGAGPAGALAALELARAGMRVVIADDCEVRGPKLGETPGVGLRLLRMLGIAAILVCGCKIDSFSIAAPDHKRPAGKVPEVDVQPARAGYDASVLFPNDVASCLAGDRGRGKTRGELSEVDLDRRGPATVVERRYREPAVVGKRHDKQDHSGFAGVWNGDDCPFVDAVLLACR